MTSSPLRRPPPNTSRDPINIEPPCLNPSRNNIALPRISTSPAPAASGDRVPDWTRPSQRLISEDGEKLNTPASGPAILVEGGISV